MTRIAQLSAVRVTQRDSAATAGTCRKYREGTANPDGMSLPYSQVLRVKRVVDDPVKCDLRMKEMKKKFVRRGYPLKLVAKHIETVKGLDRKALTHKKSIQVRMKGFPWLPPLMVGVD